MAFKVTWQTEYRGKLNKDDDPRYFNTYREAKRYMDGLIDDIKNNQYTSSDRQVVKVYDGRYLVDTWDSMPKKAQVMRARAVVKRKAARRLM